jgi:hypothetical protein
MPKEALLELARPPGFGDMDDDALAAIIEQAVLRREAHFRDKHRREGRAFLGRRQIRKQSVFDAPASSAPRRTMSPRVAAKNKWRRIEVLQRLDAFLNDHRAALAMWRAGFRDVVFPRGTYAMRQLAGVAVAPG